jgi:hypothetical protein
MVKMSCAISGMDMMSQLTVAGGSPPALVVWKFGHSILSPAISHLALAGNSAHYKEWMTPWCFQAKVSAGATARDAKRTLQTTV